MTYLYAIPAHFIHEIKTKGYHVIGVTVIHRKLMRLQRKKRGLIVAYLTTGRRAWKQG